MSQQAILGESCSRHLFRGCISSDYHFLSFTQTTIPPRGHFLWVENSHVHSEARRGTGREAMNKISWLPAQWVHSQPTVACTGGRKQNPFSGEGGIWDNSILLPLGCIRSAHAFSLLPSQGPWQHQPSRRITEGGRWGIPRPGSQINLFFTTTS